MLGCFLSSISTYKSLFFNIGVSLRCVCSFCVFTTVSFIFVLNGGSFKGTEMHSRGNKESLTPPKPVSYVITQPCPEVICSLLLIFLAIWCQSSGCGSARGRQGAPVRRRRSMKEEAAGASDEFR